MKIETDFHKKAIKLCVDELRLQSVQPVSYIYKTSSHDVM